MEFKSDEVRYLIFRNKSQFNKSATLFGSNEELLILKYSQRKGKRRFYRGGWPWDKATALSGMFLL